VRTAIRALRPAWDASSKVEGHSRLSHALPPRRRPARATRTLAREGFIRAAVTNDDPVLAKKLEDAGGAVMPLGRANRLPAWA